VGYLRRLSGLKQNIAITSDHAGGSVVLFSSIGFASHTAIATAKGALDGLSLSVAAESAPAVVNAIAPRLDDDAACCPQPTQ
jgi:NAD(P)-dependent dehydrogenase (short-subunit alcohol dehydrogenase family)